MPLSSILTSFSCTGGQSKKSKQFRSNSLLRRKSNRQSQTSLNSNHQNKEMVKPSAPSPNDSQEADENSQPDLVKTNSSLTKTPSTKTEPLETYVNNISDTENFWELGNYKYALKRCDNGYKLGGELADMISER